MHDCRRVFVSLMLVVWHVEGPLPPSRRGLYDEAHVGRSVAGMSPTAHKTVEQWPGDGPAAVQENQAPPGAPSRSDEPGSGQHDHEPPGVRGHACNKCMVACVPLLVAGVLAISLMRVPPSVGLTASVEGVKQLRWGANLQAL